MLSWSFILSLVMCLISVLPAYFDHGERKKTFKLADSSKAKWEAGIKWILINWGLPILAFAVTVSQAIESSGTDSEIKTLKQRNVAQSNHLSAAESKLLALEIKISQRKITPQQREAFLTLSKNNPKGNVRVLYFSNATVESEIFAKSLRDLLKEAGHDTWDATVGRIEGRRDSFDSIGVFVPNPNSPPPGAAEIIESLAKIGLPAKFFPQYKGLNVQQEYTKQHGTFQTTIGQNENTLEIIVGINPQ